MIVLPKFKDLYIAKKIIAPGLQMSGRFKIEAIRPDGRIRLLSPWKDNLILNGGLDNIGGDINWMKNCYVGTGSATPVITQTSLDTFLVGTNTAQANSAGNSGIVPYYGWYRRTYRFAIGVAEGNLTEVGVGPTNITLSTRSLILDGAQQPTTITVLDDEILDVTWEFRQYAATGDTFTTVVMDDEIFNVTARACDAEGDALWYNWIYREAVMSTSGATINNHPIVPYSDYLAWDTTCSYTTDAYANGSHKRGYEFTCSTTQGNVGVVKSIQARHSRGSHQYGFVSQVDGDGIPKDNTKTMQFNMEVSWARRP